MNPALCSYPSVPNSEKAQFKQPPQYVFQGNAKIEDQDPGTTQPEGNSTPSYQNLANNVTEKVLGTNRILSRIFATRLNGNSSAEDFRDKVHRANGQIERL